MSKEDITQTLEALVDKHGLLHVLTGLECICGEKAEHVRTNWQDEPLAKLWDKASVRVGEIVRNPVIEKLDSNTHARGT